MPESRTETHPGTADASSLDPSPEDHAPHPDESAESTAEPEPALVDEPVLRQVAVEHRRGLAAAIGILAAVVTVAWFSRALRTGELVDWLVCAGVAAIGLLQLLVLRDSRAPLLLADQHGVRIRSGETWTGLPWEDLDQVVVRAPRRRGPLTWLRDGQVVVHLRTFDPRGPESYAVPLATATRSVHHGLSGDLAADLQELADGRVPVVVPVAIEKPAQRQAQTELSDGAPGGIEAEDGDRADVDPPGAGTAGDQAAPTLADDEAAGVETVEVGLDGRVEEETDSEPEPLEPDEVYQPVEPIRPPMRAVRAEIVREPIRVSATSEAIPAQRIGDHVVVVATPEGPDGPGSILEPVEHQLAGFGAPQPVPDPVIGPVIAAARQRARLSIDELSERTRIRPHVLECIEVDDFTPCGGDFYARGHLRTLARIFGLEAQDLLETFDERYSHGEIQARQVFEAELATGIGGGVRATTTGPRWSVLAACVVVLALAWGAARIFTDTPQELVSPAPDVVDSAGLASSPKDQAQPGPALAPIQVRAQGADPQVVVRDRKGKILWAGKLADGQQQQVIGVAPFEVTASNGQAVRVALHGKRKGAVGPDDRAASRNYG